MSTARWFLRFWLVGVVVSLLSFLVVPSPGTGLAITRALLVSLGIALFLMVFSVAAAEQTYWGEERGEKLRWWGGYSSAGTRPLSESLDFFWREMPRKHTYDFVLHVAVLPFVAASMALTRLVVVGGVALVLVVLVIIFQSRSRRRRKEAAPPALRKLNE